MPVLLNNENEFSTDDIEEAESELSVLSFDMDDLDEGPVNDACRVVTGSIASRQLL